MDVKERIAGLPEYPKDGGKIHANPDLEERKAWAIADFALARLALAREWIAVTHLNECSAGKWSLKTGQYEECDCGRDALLKALEVPRG